MEKLGLDAIQSLNTLNDQIFQFIVSPSFEDVNLQVDLTTNERETLKSSMVLMRQLLVDAQTKFRKMMEDNKMLANKIDSSITAANLEVGALRSELEMTNKRLNEITVEKETEHKDIENKETDIKDVDKNGVSSTRPTQYNAEDSDMKLLLEQNSCLEQQVHNLQRELHDIRAAKVAQVDQPGVGEYKLELIQTNQELARAKEALVAMKADRKRLKAEKLDLLHQMKQLYGTLEDKEAELRDFIRNYEQRMKESDESIRQLASEKEDSENEKWEILKRAREATERAVILRAQVDLKEQCIKRLEQDLHQSRQQVNQTVPHLGDDWKQDTGNCSSTSSPSQTLSSEQHRTSSTHTLSSEQPPPYQEYSTTITRSDPSDESMGTATPRDCSLENLSPISVLSHSGDDLRDPDKQKRRSKRTFLTGSLSRVFSRSRNRRSLAIESPSTLDGNESMISGSLRLPTLNQDNYQEKLKLLDQIKGVPTEQWKASQVLAWLEITLSMPMYGQLCAENVKSGKVLMGLSDSELDSALGISNPMHRRKIRLAIEELREPAKCKYPKCSLNDHTWVAHRWIHDIGLPQYSAVFQTQLVDGRLLNNMSKKDLEKYLGINRKFHQVSLLHAVELLRRVGFEREVLVERRAQCCAIDSDPIVWTNERVRQWVRNIDLDEYADNLRETGVHGAMMVLEPSFNAETMAAALGIPPSKSYVRRHLTTEFDSLVQPVRSGLEASFNGKKRTGGGSLGRSFHKSLKTDAEPTKKKLVFRGSLGRAFGRKVKQEMCSSINLREESPGADRRSSTDKPQPKDQLHGIVV